jgi:uncharacterized membrane protein YfhO
LTINATSFTIDAPSKGIIVLNEAFLKRDFVVPLNGKSVRYFRLNHAYKGVMVNTPGRYAVSFSYWPWYFTLSLWISAAGLFLLFIWIGYLWQAGAKNKKLL